jgi:hypothetical protein
MLARKLKEQNILVQDFFLKQIMVCFGEIISSFHDKEIKGFWLGDKTIGF